MPHTDRYGEMRMAVGETRFKALGLQVSARRERKVYLPVLREGSVLIRLAALGRPVQGSVRS